MKMDNFNKKDAMSILGPRGRSNFPRSSNNGTSDSQNTTNPKTGNRSSKWGRFIDKMKDINAHVIPALKDVVGMFVSIIICFKSGRAIYAK